MSGFVFLIMDKKPHLNALNPILNPVLRYWGVK